MKYIENHAWLRFTVQSLFILLDSNSAVQGHPLQDVIVGNNSVPIEGTISAGDVPEIQHGKKF